MRVMRIILVISAGLSAGSCAPFADEMQAVAGTPGTATVVADSRLPTPVDLSRAASDAVTGTLAFGAQADPALPAANVSDSGFAREFATGETEDWLSAAYSIYRLELVEAPANDLVALGWIGTLPAEGAAWLGLANWETNRWEWFPAGAASLVVGDIAAFVRDDNTVLAAVLLYPDAGQAASATLGWLSVGGPPAEAGALFWNAPLEIAASSEITTAFNNAQPVLRTRDLAQLFIGYKADDGLHLALVEDGAVSADSLVSTLPSAAGLTIDERPGGPGELWIGYTYPGGVVLRGSLDHGASFSAESDLPGSGVLPAAVSLSFADDGAGYALWQAGAPDTQVTSATLDAAASAWGAGAVLETAYSPSAFACVWARGGNALGVWRSDTVAGPGQAWKVRFAEHDGAGWGAISTVGGASMNYDPSVVRLADNSVALAYFEIGQILHLYTAPSAADPFAESYSPPDFGRFPGLRSNGAGILALTYEYQAEPGDNHDNTIKECGLSVSFDGGANWLHRACDPALIGAKSRIYSHCWLSEPSGDNAGRLDFIWIDASATPQKLYLQTAEVVVF